MFDKAASTASAFLLGLCALLSSSIVISGATLPLA